MSQRSCMHADRVWALLFALTLPSVPGCGADHALGGGFEPVDTESQVQLVVIRDDSLIRSAPNPHSAAYRLNAPRQDEQWPFGATFELVSDEGDWLQIRSLAPRTFHECSHEDRRLWSLRVVEWQGWVPRDSLVRVLGEPTRVDFGDGTWVELDAGVMISLDAAGVPHALVRTLWEPGWAIALPELPSTVADSYGLRPAAPRPRGRVVPPASMPSAARLGGVPVPEEDLRFLQPAWDAESIAEGTGTRFTADCATVQLAVEAGAPLYPSGMCSSFRGWRVPGTNVPEGAAVLSTSGEVLGSLRYTWEIEAWPHTFGNLVCFDANVVRDRYFYGSGVDAGPACDDCVCFRSDDVILDPIWAYRNRVGAIDRDGDDRWALIELMETSCPKCTAPAYFDHFVLNLEPGILTTEMVIVAERNGLLTRREAIAALHLLGETEMAGVLEQHLLAILPREE